MIRSDEKRVFLEVRDAAALVDDLESGRGLFVPTRLPLALNGTFTLGIRLRNVTRTLDLPMLVVGRRVPRGGSLLSAGVIAKVAPSAHDSPILDILREVAAGRLVDLEARLQAQVRVETIATFATTSEALSELESLLNEGSAQFPLDQLVQRGDRLKLTIRSEEEGVLIVPHVIVKSVHTLDGRRGCQAAFLDDAGRAAVERFLLQSKQKKTRA